MTSKPALMSCHKELRPTKQSSSLLRILGSNSPAADRSVLRAPGQSSSVISGETEEDVTNRGPKMKLRRQERPNYSVEHLLASPIPHSKSERCQPPTVKSSKVIRKVKLPVDTMQSMLLAATAPSPEHKEFQRKSMTSIKMNKVRRPATLSSLDSSSQMTPTISLPSSSNNLSKEKSRKRQNKGRAATTVPSKRRRTKKNSSATSTKRGRRSDGRKKYAVCGTCQGCQVQNDCGACFQCVRRADAPKGYHIWMLCRQRICATPVLASSGGATNAKKVQKKQEVIQDTSRPDPPCSPSGAIMAKMEPEGLRTPMKLDFCGTTAEVASHDRRMGAKGTVTKQPRRSFPPDPPATKTTK